MEEIKLSQVPFDSIVYIENPKDLQKKLLKLIGEVFKTAGDKINIQNSIVFLYYSNS